MQNLSSLKSAICLVHSLADINLEIKVNIFESRFIPYSILEQEQEAVATVTYS